MVTMTPCMVVYRKLGRQSSNITVVECCDFIIKDELLVNIVVHIQTFWSLTNRSFWLWGNSFTSVTLACVNDHNNFAK